MLLGKISLLLIILIEYFFSVNQAVILEGDQQAFKHGTNEDNGDSNDCLKPPADTPHRNTHTNMVKIKPETIKEFKEFVKNSLNSEISDSKEAKNLLLKAESNNNYLTQQDFRSFDFIIKQIKNKVDNIHKETENDLSKGSHHYKLDENTIANVGTIFLLAKAIFNSENSRKQCEIIEKILLKYKNKDYLNKQEIKSLQHALARVRKWIEHWVIKKKGDTEGYNLPDENLKLSPFDSNDEESRQEIDTILLVSDEFDEKKTKVAKRNIFNDFLNVLSKVLSGITYAYPTMMVNHVKTFINQFLPKNNNSTLEAEPNSTFYSISSSAMLTSTQTSIIHTQNQVVADTSPSNVKHVSTQAPVPYAQNSMIGNTSSNAQAPVIYAPGPVISATPSSQSYNNNSLWGV